MINLNENNNKNVEERLKELKEKIIQDSNPSSEKPEGGETK